MTRYLSPIGNAAQLFDDAGILITGGAKLWTYAAGTTTPANTYPEPTGTNTNANPLVASANGRFTTEIWFDAGATYKLVFTEPDGTVIPNGSFDNIPGINDTSGSSGDSGAEWVASGLSPSYISGTQFNVTGNYTTLFAIGTRVKYVCSGGTLYGTVSAVSFSTSTTVTIVPDGASLDSGLTTVATGLLTAANPAVDAGAVSYKSTISGYAAATVGKELNDLNAAIDAGTTNLQGQITSGVTVYTTSSTPSGTTNAYVLTTTPTTTSYTMNALFTVLFDTVAGTTANTININGIAVAPLKGYDATGALVVPTIPAGTIAQIAYDGTNWVVLNEVSQGIQLSSFTGGNQALTSTGFQKLPGGLIIQWGVIPVSGGGAFVTRSFSIPFPNACFGATASSDNASRVLAVQGTTQTTITVQNGGTTCFYIAIGN